MLSTNVDDLATEDGARPLLAVTATTGGTSYKPLGFRQLILTVRFVICLRKTRSPPSVNQPSRTSSSRSYTAVEVHSDDKEDEREIKKQDLKLIVKRMDFEALEQFGGVEAAVSFMRSEPQGSAKGGFELSVRTTSIWDSVFLFSEGFWYSLWLSLNSYSIFLLLIASGLSFAIGSLQQGLKDGWHDGIGTLVAVILLVFLPSVVGFYRKIAEEKELLKTKNKLEVTVERGETCQIVSVSDVKEGELIRLKKGDRVPADGLLIRGETLILDELINPEINADRNPFIFSGSVVKYGKGVMIAISTGADTALQKGLLGATVHPSEETLLQSRMNKPYELVEKLVLAVSLMILFVVLARLICKKRDDYYNDKPETKREVTMGLMANVFERLFVKSWQKISFLATFLSTMLIGVQNGIPFAITVSLCMWREKIRSYGGKSQNLSACGTMGLVSAICVDISGKLSFHEVEVDEILIGKEKLKLRLLAESLHPHILEGFQQAVEVLIFDPMTSVHFGKKFLSSWENSGLGMNIEPLGPKFDIIDHKILSTRNCFGALMRKREGAEANLHLHYNGDASTILKMCSQYYDIRGIIHDMENHRDFLEKVINDMTIKGLRPIAFACKKTNDQVFEEGGLKLLGFVGLKYSCQKVKGALKDLKDLGVKITLTSEDELCVATAIAVDLGIQCGSNNQVVEGEKFREIMKSPGMEKNELMESITVMGKATPEDKHLLLQELKAFGHVVALLGGLKTSDAPTLREADVGVTEENWSTEVSGMVSDLTVEAPKSLASILKCGRCAYLNIQKFYQIQLTTSISGLLITLFCTFISGNSPITTVHLIWVTLIMSLLGGLMMVMELNEEEVKSPLEGDRNQSLLTKDILKKIVIHVLCQTLLFLLSEYVGQKVPLPSMNEDVRHTMIFNTFILWQICDLLGVMGLATEGVVVFKTVLQSHWFLISLVGVLSVQAMVIEFAGAIVNGVKLSAVQWAICFFFASLASILEWARNTFLAVLATLSAELNTVFLASLMFVFSVTFGIHLIS
ncbi:putative calcium-transporting ATPase 13, plasma membrane-type [Momordica charantia]|uniref:Calcium-transporting ATPase 13, plasma membrane-type n=1 Tax=Momordica charantia TaxID=3673 RepID=A0A6J1C3F1_MOMCH|nr:putative calcium-transporting ATPase 13, plasma membrane-type [Momordica charantia]XP_022136265.1 putative calcium-transporting ATPase 13, plasma membrane-type [Momordica charantia]